MQRDITPWGCLNIKMSYLHKDSHYKDNTVLGVSYHHNGSPYTWKYSLYIETGLSALVMVWCLFCIRSSQKAL